MANKLRSKDFKKLNIYSNKTISISLGILNRFYKHDTKNEQLILLKNIQDAPHKYINHKELHNIALEFIDEDPLQEKLIEIIDRDVPLHTFGRPLIKSNAYQQMQTALKLPVAVQGAMMPDAHLGYGLPIGGVLAAHNAVIPYAIGMDIGCRMSLTIYDTTQRFFKMHEHKFKQSIKNHTAFGLSKGIEYAQEHEFLDRDVFTGTPLLKSLKSKAARQLGSSGSGNHFVEWGIVDLEADELIGLPAGQYIGLLAHSGSRGFGASIAKFYADLAKNKSLLPHNMRHLSYLGMDTESGQEYWNAMHLAGDFASACHDRIHINVAKDLGLRPITKIENPHNFAWREVLNGEEVIVHRKGATPAGKDALGIIPSSMTAPGYIVKGLGNDKAINSASHGAGRKYSRKETISKNTNSEMKKHLKQQRVSLIGGALDESPFAYKSLEQVMSFQEDLVSKVGKFTPRIVRMARPK